MMIDFVFISTQNEESKRERERTLKDGAAAVS